MIIGDDGGRYADLADLVEGILDRCDDDPACIAVALNTLEPGTRNDILSSDLLNAWQVFWYYFQAYPGDEQVEFLVFHSAGELSRGVPMGVAGIFRLTFIVKAGEPCILIEDDIIEIARFKGLSSWSDAQKYLENEG
ncbi:MAG TPA: hypothetical protein VN429_02310 [Methanospirillum sp.]|uniref:hypothetical protein n=1 Tax=Methanospirillum sp. TaxID=45200 RepID=UPI002CFDCAB3|nr:hypothetical protein [Methanospirillum sp.]HWQ63221.1 hypothetical protein [Methanospirillum sp.]